MANFFSKLFKKNSKKPVVNTKPTCAFVDQYTIVVPSTVMANYSLWSTSKNTPVAYENIPVTYENNKHNSCYYDCVLLPTKAFMIFCVKYNKASAEIKNDIKMRTVSVVKLKNNDKLYIFPNPEKPKDPMFFVSKILPFNVTPEINRVIVEQMKIYTR